MLGCHGLHRRKKHQKCLKLKKQARKAIKRHPICLTDSDHDFILDDSRYRYNIGFNREMSVDDRCE